jgi:DNA replication protein DnaC
MDSRSRLPRRPGQGATELATAGPAARAEDATAILDRLLHHSTTISIKGESYRLKDRKKAGLVTLPATR